MNRWWLAPVVVVMAQVALLAGMAAHREWIVRTGEIVRLRTAPIDPRDPMRGDYVRLNYELSQVPEAICRDGVRQWLQDAEAASRNGRYRDDVVYAWLEREPDGLAEITALSDRRPPAGQLFLRGRVESVQGHLVRVRYGLEALFMEQGAAAAFEREALEKEGVPVIVEAAVGPGGTAVLKDYTWATLGLTVRLISVNDVEAPATSRRRRLSSLVVELKNHGAASETVVVGQHGDYFALTPDRSREQVLEWVGERVTPAEPTPADLVTLAPGASHRVSINVGDPRWFVRPAGEAEAPPISLADVEDWQAWLRFEYRPPPPEALQRSFPERSISASRLRTRAFHPRGALD